MPGTDMRFVMGVGGAFEVDDNEASFGASTSLGGQFVKGPYEVFLVLMPRLFALPKLDGEFGAAVGMRYRIGRVD